MTRKYLYFLIVGCCPLYACMAFDELNSYATEHNLKGDRVCDSNGRAQASGLPECPEGPRNAIIGRTQNEQNGTETKEDAL